MNARLAIIMMLVLPSAASAGPKAKAAQELAEALFLKGSKEVVEHGVEAFARKVESLAVRHGDDVFHAVKSVGPKALPMIEKAGTQGGKAAKILGTHGEHGAVWVVGRPSAMNLVARHGDDAAFALVKHPGVAEPLVEKAGASAISAFTAIGPQAGRRLAILAEGEAAHVVTNPKVLDVIARFGDAGMSFVWKHKRPLAVSACLTAFIADPEPFINGTKDITKVIAETTLKPLAETPAKVLESTAQHAMPAVARSTNWTVVFLLAMAFAVAAVAIRFHLKRGTS